MRWAQNGVTYLLKGKKYWRVDKAGKTTQGNTNGGWPGLFDSTLLPKCGCDCKNGKGGSSWEFESIKYSINDGKVHLRPPMELGRQIIDNRAGNTNPSIDFTISKSVTETESFTHTAGLSLTVGTEFKTGIPFLAEGKISLSVTASYEFSYGKEKSVTKTKSAKYACIAAVGKTTTCTATLRMAEINVPYIMTVRHKKKGCKCTSKGFFRRVSSTNMHLHITEES